MTLNVDCGFTLCLLSALGKSVNLGPLACVSSVQQGGREPMGNEIAQVLQMLA